MGYVNYNTDFRRNKIIIPPSARLEPAYDIYTPHATQQLTLGMELEFDDGTNRKFRYAECGGTALAKAIMTQAEAVTPNWVDEPQTTGSAVAAAIGDKTITLLVQTAPTANDWDDGWLWVNNGTGEGDLYLIKSHTLTTTPVVTIADHGGIRTATQVTSTASDISIIKNLWKDVIVVPAAAGTHKPTGVPITAVTGDYFFWAQTRGPCTMLVDTNAAGSAVLVAGDMCGEPVDAQDDGTVGTMEADGTLQIYGRVLWVSEDLEYGLIDLQLE